MFRVQGEVTNCFTIPASEKYPKSYKVQLLGDQTTRDGQIRKEMVTLSIPEDVYEDLEKKIGTEVVLPVGLFASNSRLNIFFSRKMQ